MASVGGNLSSVSKAIALAATKTNGLPKTLGGVDLAATTAANVFQGSASGNKFSITAVNRNATVIKLRLGFSSTTATFENAKYIEYDVSIPAYGVLERTDLIIEDETYYFVAYSDTANVNVTAYGIIY
jgi:hypothetical protein